MGQRRVFPSKGGAGDRTPYRRIVAEKIGGMKAHRKNGQSGLCAEKTIARERSFVPSGEANRPSWRAKRWRPDWAAVRTSNLDRRFAEVNAKHLLELAMTQGAPRDFAFTGRRLYFPRMEPPPVG